MGRVSSSTTPEIQSVAQTTTTNSGEMIAVNTSCGRYRAKYASSASNPRVASCVISPVRCSEDHDGPASTTRHIRPCRSCDFTTAVARAAAVSWRYDSAARITVKPASRTRRVLMS